MSRLAKKSIAIPTGVTVAEGNGKLSFTGPTGARELPILPDVTIEIEKDIVWVKSIKDHKQARANAGTMWSLVQNAMQGLAAEFLKILEIEGVGYRATMEGDTLVLSLGYVNPVRFTIPAGVKITVEKNVIKILGRDKAAVGQVASQIRSLKKPEPYKGKGIRYQGEVIRRKVGKKAATAAA